MPVTVVNFFIQYYVLSGFTTEAFQALLSNGDLYEFRPKGDAVSYAKIDKVHKGAYISEYEIPANIMRHIKFQIELLGD